MTDDSPRVKSAIVQPVKGSTDWDLLMTTAEGMKVTFRLDLIAMSLLAVTQELLKPVLTDQIKAYEADMLRKLGES